MARNLYSENERGKNTQINWTNVFLFFSWLFFWSSNICDVCFCHFRMKKKKHVAAKLNDRVVFFPLLAHVAKLNVLYSIVRNYPSKTSTKRRDRRRRWKRTKKKSWNSWKSHRLRSIERKKPNKKPLMDCLC